MSFDQQQFFERLVDLPYSSIYYFRTTTSTNDEAVSMAARGAPHLTLLFADEQTAGRGRSGRRWYTVSGSALAFSLILRPRDASGLTRYSAVLTISICQVLTQYYGLNARIKWPNDVLVNGRKIAGVLVETQWRGVEPQAIILGAGVNVTSGAIPPEAVLDFPAGCLEVECGKQIDRLELLHQILSEIPRRLALVGQPGFIREWQNRLAWLGKRVKALSEDGLPVHHGVLLGLDANGGLVIELSPGKTATIYTGDVHLRLEE